jgi:hypothetical protein
MTTQAQEHTLGVEAGCPQMAAAVKQGRGIEQGCYLEMERDRLREINMELVATLEAALFALTLERTKALAPYETAYAPMRAAMHAAIAKAKQSTDATRIRNDELIEALLDCIEGFRDTAERDNGGLYQKANGAYERALNLLKPYPFCTGNPTLGDCIKAGYCKREIACNN